MFDSLAYLYGKPTASGVIRESHEDFRVTEVLGFEPSGEGEHVFLLIRKTGENTDWVAKQLALFAKVRPHDVAYAGKKDRHAVTEQWFSVWLPGNKTLDWTGFETKTIKVIRSARHTRKLKLGVLAGNEFELTIKHLESAPELINRLPFVAKGVPNYFGPQRFGINGGNVDKGKRLLSNQLRERNRNKRGLYISAVRSYLFNQLINQRITSQRWQRVDLGDVLMLDGSQSCFVVDDLETSQPRWNEGDVHLTGPLWGRGKLMTQGDAAVWEQEMHKEYAELCVGLEGAGLNQERRSLRLVPGALIAEQLDAETVILRFFLPAGCFATSVLRELCNLRENNGI